MRRFPFSNVFVHIYHFRTDNAGIARDGLGVMETESLWLFIMAAIEEAIATTGGYIAATHILVQATLLNFKDRGMTLGRSYGARSLPGFMFFSREELGEMLWQSLTTVGQAALEGATESDRIVQGVEFDAVQVVLVRPERSLGALARVQRGGALPRSFGPCVTPQLMKVCGFMVVVKRPDMDGLCLHEALTMLGCGRSMEELRAELPVNASFPLLAPLAKRYGWRVFVWRAGNYVTTQAKLVAKYGPASATKRFPLLLVDNHYFPIYSWHNDKLCGVCGRTYRSYDHLCGGGTLRSRINRLNYEKKSSMALPIVEVDDVLWGKWCSSGGVTLGFYDLETGEFEKPYFTVYHAAILFVRGDGTQRYERWYGPDEDAILTSFFTCVLEESSRSEAPVRLVSHNGARFDAFFLMRWYMEHAEEAKWPALGKDGDYSVGLNNRAFKQLCAVSAANIGWTHFDMFLHLPKSLQTLAKTMLGEKETKDYFPHEFLQGKPAAEVLYYRGPRPPASFYVKGTTEAMLDEAGIPKEDFDLAEESERYLKQDIELTFRVFTKYAQSSDLDVGGCITLPQAEYRRWARHVYLNGLHKAILCPQGEVEAAIMKAMYGGRVYPSLQYGEFEEPWVQLDICSLYPSALMADNYPLGPVYKLDEFYLIELNDLIKAGRVDELPPLVAPCRIMPNTRLTEAVLPRRDSKGSLVWDVDGPWIGYYCTPDLVTAWECGYQITIVRDQPGFYWKKWGSPFRGFIDETFKLKAKASEEGNSAMREIAKLRMNALYGKFLQRSAYDEVHAVTFREASDYLTKLLWSGEMEWLETHPGKQLMFVKMRQKMEQAVNRQPKQLGVWCLANSRRITNRILRRLSSYYDQCCRWRPGEPDPPRPTEPDMAYTDTDSFVVPKAWMDRVKDIMGNELGDGENAYLSVDYDNIVRMVAPAPKTYILQNDQGEFKRRSKGVPLGCGNNAEIFDKLRRGEAVSFRFPVFTRRGHRVSCSEMVEGEIQAFTISTDQMERTIKAAYAGRLPYPLPKYPHYTVPRGYYLLSVDEREELVALMMDLDPMEEFEQAETLN